jgi:hypothetical protein
MRLWRDPAPSTGDLTPAPPQGTQASLLGCSFLAAERPTEPRTWLAAFILLGTDGTVIWTSPTGRTYRTSAGARPPAQ